MIIFKGDFVRLKKLVITGFKSFAEKTILHFEKGITCIVGPNGCGKSNISDAFRWVLGEQSAKSLRGQKMPDIIFAGASKRQSLNFAEVSLTLTDVQDSLPIDYEEVTITRRLHRSGESEYFLNSNPVRLKDIHTLLLDSGIGKNAFSIFEQGKIDQIINYSPTDRRFIFEEAAGIVRFLTRKQEALKRLEQSDLNLSRVQDIHQEVEKNILLLQKQAEKASIFKENQFRLKQLEKAALMMRWQTTLKKQETLNTLLNSLKLNLNEAAEIYQAHCEKEKVLKQQLEDNEKRRHIHQAHFFKSQSAIDIQKSELKNNLQRIEEFQRKSGKLKRDLEDLTSAHQARSLNLVELGKKYHQIESELEVFEVQLNAHESQLKSQEQEVFKLRQEVQQQNQILLKLIQNESSLANEVQQIEYWIANDTKRLEIILEKTTQLQTDIENYTQTSENKKTQLQQISGVIDVYKDRLDQFNTDLSQLSQQTDIKKNEFENLRRRSFEVKARHQVLLKMQEDFEGFSAGTKKLMQASLESQSPLYGKLQPLYEFFKINSNYVEALTAILSNYSQTLVVQTKEDLKTILHFATHNEIYDFSLACIECIENQASQAIEKKNLLVDEKDFNHVNNHFLNGIEIWKDLDSALERSKEGWILTGGYFDPRGIYFQVKRNENHVFMREAEIAHLTAEIEQQEQLLQELEEGISLLQQRRNHMQNERIEVDSQLRREEMKLVEINFALQRALGDQEKGRLQLTEHENELKDVKEKIKINTDQFETKRQTYKAVFQDLEKLKSFLMCLQADLSQQEHALNTQQHDEKQKGQLYQKMLEEKNRLSHECHLLESKSQDYEVQFDRITNELSDNAELQHELEDKNSSLQSFIRHSALEMQEMLNNGSVLEQEMVSLKNKLLELEQETKVLETSVKDFEIQKANVAAQVEHVAQLIEAYQAESKEKYSQELWDLVEIVPIVEKTVDQIEKQMRQLKQLLNEAGDVNLMAIEELEKHRVRFNFLAQQITDLTQTKQELLQIINQLDQESLRLFRETFDKVRSNFQKNFAILFNGGEADLQFTDNATTILEAGIDIIAKPPGKQMRSISLLSGGEKCLTAVALLFAIFEVKSSPFCILDEIDAPLDDTNIDRFVNVVRHFADRCQFLIITHNKRTMAISDRIFGVSMEEKGVSKLLSLEFSHDSEPEVALV